MFNHPLIFVGFTYWLFVMCKRLTYHHVSESHHTSTAFFFCSTLGIAFDFWFFYFTVSKIRRLIINLTTNEILPLKHSINHTQTLFFASFCEETCRIITAYIDSFTWSKFHKCKLWPGAVRAAVDVTQERNIRGHIFTRTHAIFQQAAVFSSCAEINQLYATSQND